MSETQMATMLRTWLMAALVERGVPGVAVRRAFQPTQQGRPDGPAILFSKAGEHRHGYPKNVNRFNVETQTMERWEVQYLETTWQFGSVINEDPADDAQLTADDILKVAASCFQNPDFVKFISAQNMGVLRITDIRAPFGDNDRDQFESNPQFDVIITHRDEFRKSVPVFTKFNTRIKGI